MGMLPAAIAIARHHAARADTSLSRRREVSAPLSPETEARLAEIRSEHACRRLDRQIRQGRIMLVVMACLLAVVAACVVSRIA